MYPNFLIIGAMKSGTSSLWGYLRSHPEILMSREKELNFFVAGQNWEKGLQWYEAQFADWHPEVKSVGEASTSYSKYPAFPGVPARIASLFPKMKLIYILRDPIARIQSMYEHMVSTGAETRPIGEVLADLDNNHYVDLSLYFFQISQYLSYFPLENILVLAAEDLRRERKETIRKTCEFLDVSQEYVDLMNEVNLNVSASKRPTNRLGNIIKRIPVLKRTLSAQGPLSKQIYNLSTRPVDEPVLSPELRDNLAVKIRPDTDQLRSLVGQKFSAWSL